MSDPESPASVHAPDCSCRLCAIAIRRAAAMAQPLPMPIAGDSYHEGNLTIFTAQYHRRRGYCCGNDCRHCPYDADERSLARRRPS